ncbi:MAG: ABC transporter ATP-binding protein [Nitrospiria bacterium]
MKKKKSSRFKQVVLNHLRQVKGSLFFAVFCMLGFTATELLTPWPLKIIFDYILLEKSVPPFFSFLEEMLQKERFLSLVIMSSAILFIALFRGIFSYFQIFITSRIGFQLVYTLRRELFGHLQRLSLSFHNRTKSGEILTKITGDTKVLRDVFAESALIFTAHLMTIIGMFVVMFVISWQLTLIVLTTFPILTYTLFYLYQKIKASAKKQRKQEGKVASRISELLTMVPLVQAFGREEHEERQFDTDSAQTLEESIRTARMVAATTRTVEIISACGIFAAVLFGSLQVLKGLMTPGDILIFAAYLTNMYNPLKKVAGLSTKFSKAMASAERISEILEIAPEIQDRPHAIRAENLKAEILFKDVSFDYGDGREILKNVSFVISPGQRVALIGASGAGKSTIISLILRLYDPQEGGILIDGVDIKDYQRESLRREVGIVLQDSVLLGATIKENISYGKPDATEAEIEEAARQAHAHNFIMALPEGYEAIIGERGSTLSGGQRQRICLARAMIKRPSILILDEPTSAVDAESELLIRDAIAHLQKGKTTLMIAHNFSSIKGADQILVLKDGEMIERGTHDQLLNLKGYYYDLFRLQGPHMESFRKRTD